MDMKIWMLVGMTLWGSSEQEKEMGAIVYKVQGEK